MLFTVTSPLQATAGAFLTFRGSITPDSALDYFLNGISYAWTSPADVFLTGDQLTFFNNTPGLYFAGDPVYSGPVFSITVSPNTPAGVYTGTAILLGGADAFALDPVVSAAFSVIVPTAIPEPGGVQLGFAGAALVALVQFRRRVRS